MNRLYHALPDLETLLAGQPVPHFTAALLVPGDRLHRVVERELADLHERRRRNAGTPAEAEILRAIGYWQEALAWVKPYRECDLVLSVRLMRRDG